MLFTLTPDNSAGEDVNCAIISFQGYFESGRVCSCPVASSSCISMISWADILSSQGFPVSLNTRPLAGWLRQILRIHWVVQAGARFATESSTELTLWLGTVLCAVFGFWLFLVKGGFCCYMVLRVGAGKNNTTPPTDIYSLKRGCVFAWRTLRKGENEKSRLVCTL